MRSRNILSLALLPAFVFTMLVTILSLCPAPTGAQTFFGSVVGTITDTTGAIVPGATVTITDLATNESRTAKSDAAGEYRFVNLVPANYKVLVEAGNFKRFLRQPVAVAVDTTLRIDAALQVGAATETVEVSTQAPLLQTEQGSLGDEVEGKTVQEMPLNGRNTLNLMELVPGVVPQGNTSGSAAMNSNGGTSSAAWGNYQIGGGMPLQSTFYIDGAPVGIMNKNFQVLVPTQDIIQEFKVETSAVSPEFGRFAGGVVNMASKSGSNAFHGTVYEYLRNNVVNANYFFTKRSGGARPQWTQNQYGGAVGGPIWKNKAFFFFAWESIAIRTGVPYQTNIPTPAMQSGIIPEVYSKGVLQNSRVYDPRGICNVTHQAGTASAPGTWTITNLATCGDPTAAIFKTFYANNVINPNNLTTNYNITLSQGDNGHQMTGRVDYDLTGKQRIFARFTLWPLVDEAPNYMSNANGWNSANSQTHNHTNQIVAGETYTINPTTVLDIRADYIRQYGDAIPPGFGSVDISKFGPAYATLAPEMTYKNFPSWSFSGGTELHGLFNFGYNNLTRTYYNNYHLSGSLTKIVGKHTLKMGAEGRLSQRDDVGSDQACCGSFTFSDDIGGDEYANFLMGYFDKGSVTTVKAVTTFNYYKGIFFGDTWQAAQKLTLNLGLRWESPGTFAENGNNLTVLLPNTVDPYTGLIGSAGLVQTSNYLPRGDLQVHNALFGPRVGVAYRLTNSTAIRAGYALSFLPPDQQIGAYANASLVTSVNTIPTTNSAASLTPTCGSMTPPTCYTTSNPFPNGILPATGRFLANGTTLNTGFTAGLINSAVSAPYPFEPYPHSQEMNLSIGHEMRGDTLIDVGYAHALGTHLPSIAAGLDEVPEANILSNSCNGAALNTALTGSSKLTYGGVALGSNNQVQAQICRPYPAYTNYSNSTSYHGTTSYNALELKVQKRFKSAGQIGGAYTWMKMIGDTDTVLTSQETKAGGVAGSGEGTIQDYNNMKGERSIYSYDVPNRLVISYVLDLPFGEGQRFGSDVHGVAGKVISGWSANGITTLESGYPVYLYTSGNPLSKYLGAGTIRPNYTAGCAKTVGGSGYARSLSGNTWFNASCFTLPNTAGVSGPGTSASYGFGNESRTDDAIKSSGVDNFDFSLVKSTAIHDQMALQFRVEFFNIFNRVQFGPPVTEVDAPAATPFGSIQNQANQPRLIQGALRLNF